MQGVRNANTILTDHCKSLQSQCTKKVLVPLSSALFGSSAEWAPVDTSLPCRCGHHAAVLKVKDKCVMVVIGGIANAEWHASTLVVTGLDTLLPERPGNQLQVFEAASNSNRALPRREFAVCAIADDQVLILGGLVEDRECMDMWVGQLCADNGVCCGPSFWHT
jgi:hypothetical protein